MSIFRLIFALVFVTAMASGPSFAAVGEAKKPTKKPVATVAQPVSTTNGNGNGATTNGNGNGASAGATNGNGNHAAHPPVIVNGIKLKEGEKPVMDPKVVQSKMTAEEAIPLIFVTAPYDSSLPDTVITGADGGWVTAQISKAFRTSSIFMKLDYRQGKGRKKFSYNHHYELGDPLDTDETIAKVKDSSYIPLMIDVDFNTALDGADDQMTTGDFMSLIEAKKFKKNAQGRELQRLLKGTEDAGEKWEIFGEKDLWSQRKNVTKAKLMIFGQKVFGKFDNEKEKAAGHPVSMRPIDHNKEEVWGYVDEKTGELIPAGHYQGGVNQTLPANVVTDPTTGKRSPMYRVNSLYVVVEPNILQNRLDVFNATIESFGDGNGIEGIKHVQPVQANLVGGGSIAAYDTFGVMNPGSLWVNELNDAITTWKTDHKLPLDPQNDLPARHKTYIKYFGSQQFDMSYTPQLLAEERYFGLNTDAETDIMIDAQFSKPGGYGFTPVYGGFPLDRELGGQVKDFHHAFTKNPNFHAYVFFAPAPGIKRTEASDNPTDVVLLHAKDQDIELVRDGQDLFRGEWGSFNRSGHIGKASGQVGNSESRLVVEIPMTSPLAKAMRERPEKIRESQAKLGRVYTIPEFVAMSYIANLTGRLLEYVDIKDVQDINKMIQQAESLKTQAEMEKAYTAILDKIQAIYDSRVEWTNPQTGAKEPVELAHPKSKTDFDAEMGRMKATFVDFYSSRPVPATEQGNGLYVQSFWTLLEHIRNHGEDALEIEQDFQIGLWRRWSNPDDLKKDIATLWTKSQVSKPLPPDQPAGGDRGKPGDVKPVVADSNGDSSKGVETNGNGNGHKGVKEPSNGHSPKSEHVTNGNGASKPQETQVAAADAAPSAKGVLQADCPKKAEDLQEMARNYIKRKLPIIPPSKN